MAEGIGHFHPADAAAADENVDVMTAGVANHGQVAFALAHQFIDQRHGNADVTEASDGQQAAVRHVFADGFRHRGALVRQFPGLVFPHPLAILIRVVPADRVRR